MWGEACQVLQCLSCLWKTDARIITKHFTLKIYTEVMISSGDHGNWPAADILINCVGPG